MVGKAVRLADQLEFEIRKILTPAISASTPSWPRRF
jgi:hypothetical protein